MPDAPGSNVPFPPMEAELVSELPAGGGWRYEPKWDGFRGVLENDGGELALWSRNARPLLRYFPELRPLGEKLPPHSAIDGEIVIERGGRLDFDAMQMRLHPAESRVRRLSAEIPAQFIAFDVLLWKGKPIHQQPLDSHLNGAIKTPTRPPFFINTKQGRDPLFADRPSKRLTRQAGEDLVRAAHYLRDKGLLTVYDQTMRMSIKARLHQGLRRWKAERPDGAGRVATRRRTAPARERPAARTACRCRDAGAPASATRRDRACRWESSATCRAA